jgi:membrane associated rhomboid family serine protease
MARFRGTSSMMSFPSLSGVTGRLVIANIVGLFLVLVLQYAAPRAANGIAAHLLLVPALLVHGWIWQLFTYSFLGHGVLNVAFNMLTFWFIGAYLETSKGGRWLLETYFLCAAGGGLLGSALCFTHLLGSSPLAVFGGADAAVVGMLVAFATLYGDLEMMMFPLPIAIKARYVAIVVVLIDLAYLISGGVPLAYFTVLSGALLGFLGAKRNVSRRTATAGISERFYGFRNSYYRWKRRRAARKFEVYMRKQNRDVHFDDDGRYIDPDDDRGSRQRNSNDRKWMN